MKQTDIAMLILITSISLLISYFVGNALFANDEKRTADIPVVQSISADFVLPDDTVFNDNAVNLTEKIEIENRNNNTPFSAGDN